MQIKSPERQKGKAKYSKKPAGLLQSVEGVAVIIIRFGLAFGYVGLIRLEVAVCELISFGSPVS